MPLGIQQQQQIEVFAGTKAQVFVVAVKKLFFKYPTKLVDKQFKFQIQFVKFPLMATGLVERPLVFPVRDMLNIFKVIV